MKKVNYFINIFKAVVKALDVFMDEFKTLEKHDGKTVASSSEDSPNV